ncbi:MAG: TlpA family protein disulfide reductase [Bacteroidaceae bacterium]|nr:TlpA family protein disulfide reductase [Bacteroidaceae bacterium]
MKKTFIVALFSMIALGGQAKEKVVVWEQPCTEVNTKIEGFFDALLEIRRVEFAKDETRVMMHIADRPEEWVKISSESYLRANGKKYALKSLDGMEMDKETHLTDHGYVDVVMHFEPLPANTQRFDFTEGEFNGAWELLGVEQPSTRAAKLFPSNWRNTETGDWDISFYDECAIYDCQFWNYKQKQQKGDKYTIVLENNGKEITVNVDKNKNGVRNITIDGKTGLYNLISSIALPDYPQKDTRADFKDTNYKTDTVTFIGWLKDMPENMKKMGNEYSVMVYDDIFSEHSNSNKSYAKMDSLGRFVMKIHILNSTDVYYDWDRTFVRTLFEPGETYLMLYDFKGGHKLFMGKNCRLQNETLANPIHWGFRYADERDMDKEKALAFMQGLQDDKAKALQELEKVITARPNTSDRYINYLKGHYDADMFRNLMQGQFYMKNRKVPAEIMDCVNQYWKQQPHPYTLYRELSTFKRDYIYQLITDRYNVPVGGGYVSLSVTVYPYILRKYRDAGKLQISDDELKIVERYAEGCKKYCGVIDNDEAKKKASNEFYTSELAKQFGAIYEREDVKKIIEDEAPMFEVYKTLSILDSIGCDQDMRDIFITNELFEMLDHERQPLSDNVMNYLEENVKMPAAKDFLKAKNEKYLAILRRDISKSPSLKSAEDVANMSDGEQMLRKLTEPYRGKIILMDIWGTWCGPCKEALSHSQEEYKRLKDYDLVYLYLANRSPEESWQNIIKEYEVLGDNVVHYNLPEDQQQAIEHFVKITGYPTFRLIDREGNLLDVNADPRDLEGLARLLEKMK